MAKSLTQQAEEAHEDYALLTQLIRSKRKFDVLMGQQLYRLKAGNSFKKAVGEGVDTWEDFLKMPEISLSTGDANRLVELYEVFVLRYGYPIDEVAEAKVKSLHYILPLVKSGKYTDEQVDYLLESAKSLPQAQLRESIYDMKSETGERTYSYLIMKRCNETNNLEKVHNISSEEIIKAFNL